MRKFFSYGPVDCEIHFCVPRKELIKECMEKLIGEKFGHYFTVWAPRQTGKTWLMREVKKEIEKRYPDKFIVGMMSVQGVRLKKDSEPEEFLTRIPILFRDTFDIKISPPTKWEDFQGFFYKEAGIFTKPVILFIDEFDSLLTRVIDELVTIFRDIYLKKENYLLHGLALIGVRAVLGVKSERGSPFNIQRSLRVENFTFKEVKGLYNQYIEESGQKIEDDVIEAVYKATQGQPGLTCWFGELLTEKYNPGKDKVIDIKVWKEVYRKSLYVEWNNTVLNLLKKAQSKYFQYVLKLFENDNVKFSLDKDWCNYLYMNGIITYETVKDLKGDEVEVCRFSNPFIQTRLYNAFTYELIGEDLPVHALRIGDELEDVFEEDRVNLRALIDRYRDYLKRLKQKGLKPFKKMPRRSDLNIYEAIGHFHLYHWLMNAIGDDCYIIPEFPTGNGKVDLHIKYGNKKGIIEIKSFESMSKLKRGIEQAAKYSKQMGIKDVVLVLFLTGVSEEEAMSLQGEKEIQGVRVTVEPVVIDF